MREISTENIKIGEHVLIDGEEYVAEEDTGKMCGSCALHNSHKCKMIVLCDDIIFKKVEKKLTEKEYEVEEKQDKDAPMTNLQLAEWLAKGHGQVKIRDSSAVFSVLAFYEGEDNEAVNDDTFIRLWGTHEWVRPTVEIYKRDCRK